MKIFLVGATGRTGKWILKTALAKGHFVTALVREPVDRIAVTHPSLKLVPGDLLQTPNLSPLIADHDAIISALDSGSVDSCVPIIIDAAEQAQVPRFVGVAGGGILQLDAEHLRRDRSGYPEIFRQSSSRHLRAWKSLESSSLNWTLICTPDLKDAPATGLAQAMVDYMPAGKNSVALGDVAEFIVNEIEKNEFSRTRVGFTEAAA